MNFGDWRFRKRVRGRAAIGDFLDEANERRRIRIDAAFESVEGMMHPRS